MTCNECEMLSINGHACHETGCPNTNARYDHGEWIKQYKCFNCGYMADCDPGCDCQEPYEDDDNAD
jgi:hypothetical protein